MNKKQVINKYNIDMATLKNWIKTGLNIDINSHDIDTNVIDIFIKDNNKLSSRSNKKSSKKKVIPRELTSILNLKKLSLNIEIIDKYMTDTNNQILINTLIFKRIEIIINDVHFKNKKYLNVLLRIKNNITLIDEGFKKDIDLENNNYLLGVLVQYIMGSGEQSNLGSFYTPIDVIQNLIPEDIENKTFLDPCSGSGYILIELFKRIKLTTSENPLKFIYGNDINNNAVLVSIIELISLSNNEKNFIYPNITNKDGLALKNTIVDIVITNPPYGAKINNKALEKKLKSKESYSFFLFQSLFKYTHNKGKVIFVLPDSVLKINTHIKIREYILNNGIYKIDFLGKKFKGVLSDIVVLYLDKSKVADKIEFKYKENISIIEVEIIKKDRNLNINKYKTISNNNIIENLLKEKYSLLKESDFYLGIVTGNNKKKISPKKTIHFDTEVIQGKNFDNDLKFYISLKDKFQQSPNLNVFKRNKIVYKFISNEIKSKVDFNSLYTINSVNIYSPTNKTKKELIFISDSLNSEVSDFILKFYFGDIVRVLKEHLCSIPIFENKEEIEHKFNELKKRYLD